MTIERIIQFAKESGLRSTDLLAASSRLEEDELREILRTVGGIYFFGEEYEIEEYDEYEEGCHFSENKPILASRCFEENEDIVVTSVFFNDKEEIVIGGYSIQNGPKDNYWFFPDDFCEGQLDKITEEIITYR